MTASTLWLWTFRLLSVAVALAAARVAFAPVAVVMPNMAHYLPEVPVAMLAHIVFGPLALFLAPFQLAQGLRRARPGLHRRMGRLYGLAVLAAGVGSLAMLPHLEVSRLAAAGFLGLGLAWIGSTAMGIQAARRGDVAAHRAWMIRSVALCFSAVTIRLYMAPMMAAGMTPAETYEWTTWACWVPNLIAVEWWLRQRHARLA